MFIEREIVERNDAHPEKMQLKKSERVILANHLQKFSNRFRCSFLKRVVEDLRKKPIESRMSYLPTVMMVPQPELFDTLLDFKKANESAFLCLLVLSQWKQFPLQKCRTLIQRLRLN